MKLALKATVYLTFESEHDQEIADNITPEWIKDWIERALNKPLGVFPAPSVYIGAIREQATVKAQEARSE